MSSLKHVVHRRVHLERSQPANRARFGLLEKHSDYVERAKNYHKKEKVIRYLEEKSKTKNPYEFNYRMVSSSIDHDTGNVILNRKNELCSVINKKKIKSKKETQKAEIVKLHQDTSVLKYKHSVEKKKLEGLLHFNSLGFSNLNTPDCNKQNNLCIKKHFIIKDPDEIKNEKSGNDTDDKCKELNAVQNLLEKYTGQNLIVKKNLKKNKINSNNENDENKKIKKIKTAERKKNEEDILSIEDIETSKVSLASYEEIKKKIDYCKKLQILLQQTQTEKDLMDEKIKRKKVSETKIGKNEIVCYKWFSERKS